MATFHHAKRSNDLNILAALPQFLLEQVLIPHTSTKDKKALRQTCKLFQKTLDDRLTCLALTRCDDQSILSKLLNRMKHVRSLQAAAFLSFTDATAISNMIDLLPNHITKLSIAGSSYKEALELQNVQLPRLVSLSLGELHGRVSGLQCISGLTHLRCYYAHSIGSLAHLAPTLRHLDIWDYESVPDINQLTQLEVFRTRSIPSDFFQTHGHLPLRRLGVTIVDNYPGFLCDPIAWKSAPATLTHLTLGMVSELIPGVLPVHITHLQMYVRDSNLIEQAAAALPQLKKLDVWVSEFPVLQANNGRNSAFHPLDKLTNLQSLGVCVLSKDMTTPYDRERLLSSLPEAAMAVDRGVTLDAITSLDELVEALGRQTAFARSLWSI